MLSSWGTRTSQKCCWLFTNYSVVYGPIGALMSLSLYGLSAAPAFQPKMRYWMYRDWHRQHAYAALVEATTGDFTGCWGDGQAGCDTSTGRCSCIVLLLRQFRMGKHVIFASGECGASFLRHISAYISSCLPPKVAIIMASFINNWSVTRQHPSYWGIIVPYIVRHVEAGKEMHRKKRRHGNYADQCSAFGEPYHSNFQPCMLRHNPWF